MTITHIPEGKKLILGLGNPTEAYASTYHNVGKMALAYLADSDEKNFKKVSKKDFSFFKKGDVTYVAPHTFMNESGKAAAQACDYFDVSPQHLIIIHDDSDMVCGTYKITHDQRSAGHRGIESIIQTIGSQKFYRIKIGIRPQEEKTRKKAEEFVLKKISKKDTILFKEVFEKIKQQLDA